MCSGGPTFVYIATAGWVKLVKKEKKKAECRRIFCVLCAVCTVCEYECMNLRTCRVLRLCFVSSHSCVYSRWPRHPSLSLPSLSCKVPVLYSLPHSHHSPLSVMLQHASQTDQVKSKKNIFPQWNFREWLYKKFLLFDLALSISSTASSFCFFFHLLVPLIASPPPCASSFTLSASFAHPALWSCIFPPLVVFASTPIAKVFLRSTEQMDQV